LQKSLETFFGLGNQHSTRILAKYSIFHTARVGSIPSKTIAALTAELSTMKIETDLKRKIKDDILRLRDMGSYRGRRHAMGLPVRGQNTRSQVRMRESVWKVEANMLVDYDCKEAQQDRSKVVECLKRKIMYIYTGAIASSALRGTLSIVGLDATNIPTKLSTAKFYLTWQVFVSIRRSRRILANNRIEFCVQQPD
jgi:small subunit ribosomal protein S13